MCGIVAQWNFSSPIDETGFRAALDVLHHRGPDGNGFWLDQHGHVGLGHTRLSLVGIDHGAQPITNEDGTLCLVVNGEFYGYKAQRRDLERQGHRFRTDSDSEIALHLYENYGEDFVHHLRGIFALVLWDRRKRILLAARDRFGVKPLVFSRQADRFLLASNMKALIALGLRPHWDLQSVFHTTHFQYSLLDRTLLRGVFQLEPGHLLRLSEHGVRRTCFADIHEDPLQGTVPIEEAEAVARYREKLAESVRVRMEADVPICFHLSGGLDSGSVLALGASLSAKKVDAFSVCFPDAETTFNEAHMAEETAQYVGANLHLVPLRALAMLEALPAAVSMSEGTAVNGHLPAKYLLNQAVAKAGFKIAMGGEGADETLAGYPHLRLDAMRQCGLAGAADDLVRANPASQGIMLASGSELPLLAVRRRLGWVPAFLQAKASFGFRCRALLASEFLTRFEGQDAFSDFLASLNFPVAVSRFQPVGLSLYLWNKSALVQNILKTLGDGTEMAHGVEGRVPFLDQQLFGFARSLPLDMKLRQRQEKVILRMAVKDLIPPSLFARPKHPFVAPPLFFKGCDGVRSLLLDWVHCNAWARLPFFSRDRIQELAIGLLKGEIPAHLGEPPLIMALTFLFFAQAFDPRP